MKRLLPFLALVLLTAFPSLASGFPKVGEPAPSFALTSDQGKVVNSADFKGKWVVLYFYPKDFTGGCTLLARNFQRDLEKYRGRNAEIVGVSVDSAESHKSFCEKEGLNFRLLSDPEAKVSAAYNSVADWDGSKISSRNTFLIDPSGKVARVFPSVKPTGHSEEVLAALDELAAKK